MKRTRQVDPPNRGRPRALHHEGEHVECLLLGEVGQKHGRDEAHAWFCAWSGLFGGWLVRAGLCGSIDRLACTSAQSKHKYTYNNSPERTLAVAHVNIHPCTYT